MARTPTSPPGSVSRTICLWADESEYNSIVSDPTAFRRWLDQQFREHPELFPQKFARGYNMRDSRVSQKLGVNIRRIELRDGTAWSVRPSFVMPFMTARTANAEHPLFLRKFGVPFWAIAKVFGRDHMFWFRMQSSLGRASVVGTTVRKGAIPLDLLADEHHQTRDGEKTYIAGTVGAGCWLGAEVSDSAGTDDLEGAYRVFRDEAKNVAPNYEPQTVNTDGWGPTQSAWQRLFTGITILECFLHAWLSIRNRGKKHELFAAVSDRVWSAYRSVTRRSFSQRIRRLRSWAESNLSGWILEKTLRLCEKRALWLQSLDHPRGHRTSNMLDRLMRGMNRYYTSTQRLHGGVMASRLTSRSQALLWNYSPWHPSVTKRTGWQSPAEQLNRHRYHDNWLENLLISASCGGYRC